MYVLIVLSEVVTANCPDRAYIQKKIEAHSTLERGDWVVLVERSMGSGGGRSTGSRTAFQANAAGTPGVLSAASIARKLRRSCAPTSAACDGGGAAHEPSWRCSCQATVSVLLLRDMRLSSILCISPAAHARTRQTLKM